MATEESKFIEVQPFSDEMVVSMGPQHPSTHGVLKLELKLDGEIVREAIPHIGYLHRCFEKHAENLSYPQIIPFTDRMDYISAMNQNWGFCLAVEKMMAADEKFAGVPERAEYLRVLVGELNREITSAAQSAECTYEERRLLHHILHNKDYTIEGAAASLGFREAEVRLILESLQNRGLTR